MPAPPGLSLVRAAALRDGGPRLSPTALAAMPEYTIDQAIDDSTGTWSARMRLRWTNTTAHPVRTLPLRLHANAGAELGAPSVGGRAEIVELSTERGPSCTFATVRPTLVEVRFAEPIAPGRDVTLALRYRGRLRQLGTRVNDAFSQAMSSIGSLASSEVADYGLLAQGDGLVTVASAHPAVAPLRESSGTTGGPRREPEFDTSPPPRMGDVAYNGVAHYRVRTALPAGMTLVTNLVDGPPRTLGTTVVVESEGALVRDFALVAGRDLERASEQVGATRVTSVFRGRDRAKGRDALTAAASALATFERELGPYPYTELDVVEASLAGGAGGVEQSAMVLVAGMLYREPDDSTSSLAMLMQLWARLGQSMETLGGTTAPAPGPPSSTGRTRGSSPLDSALAVTVAHEVAHQYFAGVMGNDSHRHAALDEPLAQYFALVAYERLRGADEARRAMDQHVLLNYALYRLLGGADRPALRDASSFRTNIEYAGLVYGKAPYLYVALRRRLGAARLHRAIRTVLSRERFGITTAHDFRDALESAAGGPSSGVRPAFRRWLEEAHGDEDLGVDGSGERVLDILFPPDVAAPLRQAASTLGMAPGDLLRMMFGGGIGDDAPVGPGIDPDEALRLLDGLRRDARSPGQPASP
ncbi:MAG: hypothetical protein IT379_34935 [Deltaproteobacteria bacterium]|nr:hypothetical protein [Deltaproteobacteria bacterium]